MGSKKQDESSSKVDARKRPRARATQQPPVTLPPANQFVCGGDAEAAEAASRRLAAEMKRARSQRGWSLERLAEACGVSRSMLSQIERHEANPTLAVAIRIAGALGLSLGGLIEAAPAKTRIEVIRARDPAHLYRTDPECQIRTLSPLPLEKDVEFYEVRLRPSGALRSAAHFRGTREFLTVEQGKIAVESDGERAELARGDSANYPADVPHAIVNLGRTEAVLFLVVIYP